MRKFSKSLRWSLGAAAFALAPAVAQAADSSAQAAPKTDNGWLVTVGGMALVAPRYAGASQFGLFGAPTVNIRRRGEPASFSAPDDSFDYTLWSSAVFRFGTVAAIRPARSVHDDARLRGLDNYSWVVEAGVFGEYWAVPDVVRARVEIRHGVTGHGGFVADIGGDVVQKSGPFTVSAGPRASWVDSVTMQTEFGVTPIASARNGLFPPYDAHAGFKSAGVSAALSQELTPQWTITAFERFDRLMGDAAESPITRKIGSREQWTFGIGANYTFEVSGW